MLEGKTNWKFVLIVVFLGLLAFGGTIIYTRDAIREMVLLSQFTEVKKPEKVKVTEELVNKIIDRIILENKKYNQETAHFLIDDLNNDRTSEIIVCLASSPGWEAEEAYLTIVNPTDENGNYKKIADFVFSKSADTPFLGVPCVDGVENLIDIEGDGKKEIILNLGLLGVSGYAYGIFKIDWDLNKINWLKIRDKDGSIENSYFLTKASLMYRVGFYLEDVDIDRTMEIIEIRDGRVESESEANWVEEGNNYWKREYLVYQWNGSIFNYNEELSNLLLETANWKTYRNEEYRFEFKYPKIYDEKEEYTDCRIRGGKETTPGIYATFYLGTWTSISICDSEGKSLPEYVQDKFINFFTREPFNYKIESKENVSIGGRETIKISYRYGVMNLLNTIYFLLEDKKIFKFEMQFGFDSEELICGIPSKFSELDIFNQVISTFRFLE